MRLGILNNKDFIDLLLENIDMKNLDKSIFDDIDEPIENALIYLNMTADGKVEELKKDSIVHAVKFLNEFLDLLKKLRDSGHLTALLEKFNNLQKKETIN